MALPAWSVHHEAMKDWEQKSDGNPVVTLLQREIQRGATEPQFCTSTTQVKGR
jgi:hypothetical protein